MGFDPKSDIPLHDFISARYGIEFKEKGNNFIGSSPFGPDNEPSFIVSFRGDRWLWNDYSSEKGGDIYSIVMDMEGKTFKEAKKIIFDHAGGRADRYKNETKKYINKAENKSKKTIDYSKTASICKKRLNKKTIDYLNSRGFDESDINKFSLGYSENWIKGGEAVTIPIFNSQNKVVGVEGRYFKAREDGQRYSYTGKKEGIIFNEKRIKNDKNAVVLCEGILNVMSLEKAGIPAVATIGKENTNFDFEKFKGVRVYIGFDGDPGGFESAKELKNKLKGIAKEVNIINPKEKGKDWNDILKSRGAPGLLSYVRSRLTSSPP